MAITAFQPSAFQNNAFQIIIEIPVITQGKVKFVPIVIDCSIVQKQLSQKEKIMAYLTVESIVNQKIGTPKNKIHLNMNLDEKDIEDILIMLGMIED